MQSPQQHKGREDCSTLVVHVFTEGERRVRLARCWVERCRDSLSAASRLSQCYRSWSLRGCNLSSWSLRPVFIIVTLLLGFIICFDTARRYALRTEPPEENVVLTQGISIQLHSQAGLNNNENKTSVFLLMFIKSAPANFFRRTEVRRAYGWMLRQPIVVHASTNSGALRQTASHYFVIGKTRLRSVMQRLLVEAGTHKDIINGPFDDGYEQLTTKLLFTLDWALENYNFKYVLIGDDDTFINPPALLRWLTGTNTLSNRLYAGSVTPYTLVIRDPKHPLWARWYVPYSVYKPRHYPPFVLGIAYIMSYDIVRDVLMVAATERQKMFSIEDAYLGILMNLMGVKPRQPPNFIHCAVASCSSEDPMIVGPLEMPMLHEFGTRLRGGEPICNDTHPLCRLPPIKNYGKYLTF